MLICSLLLLIGGCVLSAIAGFTTDRHAAFLTILSGRVLQGIGAGTAAPMSLMLASELYQGSEQIKVISYVEMMNGSAKAFSPIIGSILLLYAWQVGFVFYVALASIAIASIFLLLPSGEALSSQMKNNPFTQWRELVPILMIGFCMMFVLYGLLFIESSLIHTPALRGVLIATPLALLVSVSYIYGRFARDSFKQVSQTIYTGLFIFLMAGCLASLQAQSILFTWVATAFVGIAAGLLLPASSSALIMLVAKSSQKRAITWLTMSRFFGVASGPIVFGVWLNSWEQNVFYLIGVAGMTGIVVLYCWSSLRDSWHKSSWKLRTK